MTYEMAHENGGSSGSTTGIATSPSVAERNKQIARRLFAALQDVDLAVIEELISADLVDHDPMFGRNAFERENLKDSAVRFKTAFPDVRIRTAHVLADGDKVLVHEIVTGTNTGPFGSSAPTNRTMRVQAAHVLRIAGGQIVEHWSVRELESMRAALGIEQSTEETTEQSSGQSTEQSTEQIIGQNGAADGR